MIFVTLGTQKEQFTRLLDYIEKSNINDEIIVQAGYTKYKSKKMKIFDFISYEEMNIYIEKADLIITHAGTGSILTPLKKGKKVIACSRLSKYKEHVDDHQKEIVDVFVAEKYLLELNEQNSLDQLIIEMEKFKPKKYKSNTDLFKKKLQLEINNNEKNNKKFSIMFLMILLFLILAIFFIKELCIGEQQLPVIYYHNFGYQKDIKKYKLDEGYTFSVETFEKEIKYLYDHNYNSISIETFNCWKEKKCKLPKNPVLITFDDGCYSIKEYVEPILKKYKMNGVLFVITDRILKKTPEFDAKTVKYIGFDYINKKSKIFEYGSHSHSLHNRIDDMPIASTLDEKQILKDLEKSSNVINSNVLAYPFGYYDKNVIHALKKSKYKYSFRIHNKKTYRNESNYLISRIGDTGNYESFKKIFESKKYNQTLLDRIKGIWVKIKYF